jgi:hypothetical protein
MLLAAAGKGALQHMFGACESRGDIPAPNASRWTDPLAFRNGFVDGQDGGERFDVDFDRLLRSREGCFARAG